MGEKHEKNSRHVASWPPYPHPQPSGQLSTKETIVIFYVICLYVEYVGGGSNLDSKLDVGFWACSLLLYKVLSMKIGFSCLRIGLMPIMPIPIHFKEKYILMNISVWFFCNLIKKPACSIWWRLGWPKHLSLGFWAVGKWWFLFMYLFIFISRNMYLGQPPPHPQPNSHDICT